MKIMAHDQAPRPRMLVHPGRHNPVRINSLRSASGRHVRLSLAPGSSLYGGLITALADVGITNASTTILGGDFEALQYCVAPPDPTGQAVIAYGKPINAGCAYMVFGNATIGKSSTGQPLVHCHAVIRTESGAVKGGHILTERCIIGAKPISVLVISLDDFELRQAYDPETNIPLLQPFAEH
jgi:hypothetical protein